MNKSIDKLLNLNMLTRDHNGERIRVKIGIIGKPHYGKTYLVKNIMDHFFKLGLSSSNGVTIAPSDKFDQTYKTVIPESCINYEYDSNIIRNLLTRQYEAIDEKETNTQSYLIMDDCMSSRHL
jgi:hypothetical protein